MHSRTIVPKFKLFFLSCYLTKMWVRDIPLSSKSEKPFFGCIWMHWHLPYLFVPPSDHPLIRGCSSCLGWNFRDHHRPGIWKLYTHIQWKVHGRHANTQFQDDTNSAWPRSSCTKICVTYRSSTWAYFRPGIVESAYLFSKISTTLPQLPSVFCHG